MLFAIDVGNTNITCAVMSGMDVVASFRITTKLQRTSDEFGIAIRDMLERKNISLEDIEDVIIASVVPGIMHSLTNGIVRYLDKKPIIVGEGDRKSVV